MRRVLARLVARHSWRGRRWLCALVPSKSLLRQWARSSWPDYDTWLRGEALMEVEEWRRLYANACTVRGHPRFSIITPVYNTAPAHLLECLLSVQMQSYPHWEHCIVDDSSTQEETARVLRALVRTDPRYRVLRLDRHLGISEATNRALAMASGSHAVFLDHDDRLSPDALSRVAEVIEEGPEPDVVYSDRDMIAPDGSRLMHLMKPDWSPETLLSGNYMFHLVCYRLDLLREVGGLRSAFDGSQDYDLLLRVAERRPRVAHVARVLYSWRQHPASIALDHGTKGFVYRSGVGALREALSRRGIRGEAEEIPDLWRGNYRIILPLPEKVQRIDLTPEAVREGYTAYIKAGLDAESEADWVVILGPGVEPAAPDSVARLASYLQLPEVVMAGGKIVTPEGNLAHAGLVQRSSGVPLEVYRGFPETESGYMAATRILRNVSAPHPLCCALRRSLWHRLGGFDMTFRGPHGLIDLALRAITEGVGRAVFAPEARFIAREPFLWSELWPKADGARLAKTWSDWLERGDPYYNCQLTLATHDMALCEKTLAYYASETGG